MARRCYGTVKSSTEARTSTSYDAALPQNIKHSTRPWSLNMQSDPSAKPKKRQSPQFHVPSVLLPSEAAKSPRVHKIHILGDDERSKFIAHALSGVYESVEMLGWRQSSTSRYRNMLKSKSGQRSPLIAESVIATQPTSVRDSNLHIDHLVVSGHGHEAAQAMEAVKHRVNDQTTVCLMNDGLGVLEDVRRSFTEGRDSTPSFMLGHMSHRLVFNRTYDSVRQLRAGQMQVTPVELFKTKDMQQRKVETRGNFVKSLQAVNDLHLAETPFDQWLRFKLPSVIFNAVVEPVCVLLDIPYEGILQNRAAQRTMHQLLEEVVEVVGNMPEIEGSSMVREYVRGKRVQQALFSNIMAKRDAPSRLSLQIQRGLPTDVEFASGYFLRRARLMGLDMKANLFMMDMIKARHSTAMERLNSYIPVEETSVSSDMSFRYRNSPRYR